MSEYEFTTSSPSGNYIANDERAVGRIQAELDAIDKLLSVLNGDAHELVERVASVLAPDPGETDCAERPEPGCQSDLAERLANYRVRAERLSDYLKGAARRVEL